MNQGPILFLSVLAAMAVSWFGFVLMPQVQLGDMTPLSVKEIGRHYPYEKGGLAERGREVYQAAGCASCHTRQVRQSGFVFDLVLVEPGDFTVMVAGLLQAVNGDLSEADALKLIGNTPATVLENVPKPVADAALLKFKDSGAKLVANIRPTGPDIARGWGPRQSVAQDYLFDQPVLLGDQRIGPDLSNVGARLPDADWHLRHLYHSRTEVKDSVMPAYPYLFTVQPVQGDGSPDALALTGEFAPEEGMEVVPKPEAEALAAYLLSLKIETPLFEAPYVFVASAEGDSQNSTTESAQ